MVTALGGQFLRHRQNRGTLNQTGQPNHSVCLQIEEELPLNSSPLVDPSALKSPRQPLNPGAREDVFRILELFEMVSGYLNTSELAQVHLVSKQFHQNTKVITNIDYSKFLLENYKINFANYNHDVVRKLYELLYINSEDDDVNRQNINFLLHNPNSIEMRLRELFISTAKNIVSASLILRQPKYRYKNLTPHAQQNLQNERLVSRALEKKMSFLQLYLLSQPDHQTLIEEINHVDKFTHLALKRFLILLILLTVGIYFSVRYLDKPNTIFIISTLISFSYFMYVVFRDEKSVYNMRILLKKRQNQFDYTETLAYHFPENKELNLRLKLVNIRQQREKLSGNPSQPQIIPIDRGKKTEIEIEFL